MGRHADHAAVYEAIDKIKSIAQMREKLENLDYDLRQDVIKVGLARSSFQFTWSFMAVQYGVPEQDWPERQARGGV
jgi:hypothetical protein